MYHDRCAYSLSTYRYPLSYTNSSFYPLRSICLERPSKRPTLLYLKTSPSLFSVTVYRGPEWQSWRHLRDLKDSPQRGKGQQTKRYRKNLVSSDTAESRSCPNSHPVFRQNAHSIFVSDETTPWSSNERGTNEEGSPTLNLVTRHALLMSCTRRSK